MHLLFDFFSTKIAYADLNGFIGKVDTMIINPLILLLFALAIVYFLFGVFQFLMNQENEEKKTSGKSHMLWGIVGIVIMLGVWTILGMILNTFGITGVNPEQGTVQLQ
jgi:succinate dehydrogenase/fumarate reductase cytochrome b subunit